jgi:LacI family transcriptional regulator
LGASHAGRARSVHRAPSVVDVAERAGVSIGTVSRVLSNSSHPVNEGTRQRVLAAAAAMDFMPNALARGLSGGRTHTIGVVVHDITDEYFNEIVRGIDDVAVDNGYLVMVLSSYRDPAKELEYVRRLRAQRCDGIVFVGGGLEAPGYLGKLTRQLEAIERGGGAVVALAPNELSWPSIIPDSEGGIAALVDHLFSLGHRRFALVSGPEYLKTTMERAGALEDALEAHGLELDPGLVAGGGFDRERGAAALEELIDRGHPFTAVVCLNDQMAVGCLRAARKLGLRVPDDFSIAGFDDLPITELLDPPLTTVRVPMRELGRQGMQSLLQQLDGRQPRRHRKLPCELVVRSSTGPVRPNSEEGSAT